MNQNENVAQLYVTWAVRYLAEARKFQETCVGNFPAGELAQGLEDTILRLAESDPAYASALKIEDELRLYGFKIQPIE